MSGVNGGNQDVDIDLGRVISAVWERKGRILGATIVAAALALVGTSLMKPSYKGETRLLIESRSPNLSGGDAAAQANDPLLDSLNITSQAQLLQSTDLIKRVARDLNLARLKEFDPAAQSFLPDPLVLIGLKQDPMSLDPEDRVIQEFREKLDVYAVENSRVIAIEFSSRDPKLAADIPNRMAEVYLQLQSGAKLDTHSETAKWLEPEIANLTQKVKEAEKKVADYRSSNGLFQTTETNSFSTQQLNDISTELARIRGERANAEARAENVRTALKAGRASDTLSDVVGSQVIQRLKEAEANLQAQISDSSTSLLEGHPRLKGLRGQLSGIRLQIESETKKILASLDNEAEMSRIRERQLMGQLNGLKADSAKAGEEEVGLRALEREATAQRQLLETYLARYREASSRLEGNSSPADARVVSKAVEPSEPYFPKIIPIVIVVSLATFIFGCLIVIVSELFSGRALRPSSVREIDDETVPAAGASAPVPAAAPLPVHQMQAEAARFDRPEPARESAKNAAALAYAKIAEQSLSEKESEAEEAAAEADDSGFTIGSVAHYLQRHDVPVAIAISPGGDAGSTATVMLAREIAESGRTVVLVDMTGSAAPTQMMVENPKLPGITDLLCGETVFGDAIHPDRLSDAHIIPHGASDPARAMRGVDRLSMIIDALADAYDLVLIECGPAEIAGISRLTRNAMAEIVLSVPGFKDEEVAELVTDFEAAGYGNLLVMAQTADRHSPRPGKRRAA
ncbi:GumC family protein [Neorhizobium galegae]|uniref:GumC family protein n=1 Tax=Neorhizobium galegae TaxID=399 RepID=UPI0006221884|nr:exopolysaccharide transport family protein [Neorhizobium galegae]KAB1126266.1 AAA family ATPase [Neorhizobium galegae]MCQ1805236.1 exopolysaccharide transport family protein [Neorhizobium galegae]CDZ55998.1 Capsular polysaccharide synthesis enzyme CpsD exopolysaccharide synthesis [Neorhizobium galegae bv. orientalis]